MSNQILVCETKIAFADGKKVVKTPKNKFDCHGNEVKPLLFLLLLTI